MTKQEINRSADGELSFIQPCLACAGAPPNRDGWVHEIKYDGYRIQAHLVRTGRTKRVSIYLRNGRDWTDRLPSVTSAMTELRARTAIIDGEAIVYDAEGRSDFGALQQAMRSGKSKSVVMMAFDLLYLDERDLRELPLLERKAILAELLEEISARDAICFSSHMEGRGTQVLAEACKLGLEGIISKRSNSHYRSGRTGDWVKAKCIQTHPFVVVGYVESQRVKESIGALLLGYYDGSCLKYAGRVGTGFTEQEAEVLWSGLQSIRMCASPIDEKISRQQQKAVTWVSPVLVAQIEYRELTADGVVRHATFKGLRSDKEAKGIRQPNASY
jgi:bifunctional non-homologous end joining protein LigD